jgi:hypothetical protein
VASLHSIEAYRRAKAALDCVDALLPNATPQRRRNVARQILATTWDDMHGFSQFHAQELIEPHMVCNAKVCPLLVAWEPISRAIRLWFGKKG